MKSFSFIELANILLNSLSLVDFIFRFIESQMSLILGVSKKAIWPLTKHTLILGTLNIRFDTDGDNVGADVKGAGA